MRRREALDAKKGRSSKWVYLVLPANIAYGPISTLIILYILQLGGTVVDASYAIALGSAVIVPAGLFWGWVSDRYQRRKAQIMFSFFALSVCLASIVFVHSVTGVVLLYGLLNFFYYANGTPLNLLVMEHSPRQRWASTFSKLQMITSLGATIGFVIAAVVTSMVELDSLVFVLFFISVVSIVFTAKFLYEPAIRLSRKLIIDTWVAMVSKTLIHPISMLNSPRLSAASVVGLPGVSTIAKLLRPRGGGKRDNYMLLFYAASFVFYLGSGFFNTTYPAGLNEAGLSKSAVFTVLFFGIMVQTYAFSYAGRRLGNVQGTGSLLGPVLARGISYAALGALFLAAGRAWLGTGTVFLAANIVLYSIAAGFAYSLFYTISNTLFFKSMGGTERGGSLGMYVAVTNLAVLAGALLSGYTSYYVGYWAAFLAAGVLTVASGYVFLRSVRAARG